MIKEEKDTRTLEEALNDVLGIGCPYLKDNSKEGNCYPIVGPDSPCFNSSRYKNCPIYLSKINKTELLYD